MKQIWVFFYMLVLPFGFGVWAAPCQADTDHQCLNLCVNGGKPTAVCLSDCRYNIKIGERSSDVLGQSFSQSASNRSTKTPANNHSVLNPPVPLGNEVILKKPTSHTDVATKDYKCMAVCLQTVKIYSSCEHQCTPAIVKLESVSLYSEYYNKKMAPPTPQNSQTTKFSNSRTYTSEIGP